MSRRAYPALTCKQVKGILKALGFTARANNAGSHDDWIGIHPKKGYRKVTVDCPKAPFSVILTQYMISQSGFSRAEFYAATKRTAKKINTPQSLPKKICAQA